MNRCLLVGLAVATVAFTGQVMAADVDMSKMTCKQAAAMEPAKMAGVAAWMSGFAAGKAGNTMVDTDKMAANAEKMKAFCGKNADATLMDAMSKM